MIVANTRGALALLGPQSPNPSLAQALTAINASGPYGVITAGWRDAEGEIDSLQKHLGVPVEDLALYERVEDIFSRDPDLFEAHRQRQDQLRQLQRLYRVRLQAGAQACYRLMTRHEDKALVQLQVNAAISQLRALDRFHARQIARVHQEFEDRFVPQQRPVVHEHRRALNAILDKMGTVLIAGGHVAVLASRLRLLGMAELLADHPLAGWSAGAMVLTDQLVLFHDRAPQGRREPELLDVGLGRVRGIVALPAASQRLELDQRQALNLLARRFAPARCLTLDPAAWVAWDGERLTGAQNVRRIRRTGSLAQVVDHA